MNKLFAVALSAIALQVHATPQTVTLSVPTMDCPVCPITIKKSLTRLEGVTSASVHFDKREAVVTFDDAQVRVRQLIDATTQAGYPSKVKP